MKLTALLLLVTGLVASAAGSAQRVSLSEKNASLEKVFGTIKKQTGFTFVYTEAQIRKAGKVSVTVSNAPLEQVLDLCFAGQPLSYTILNKMVVVKEREAVTKRESVSAPLPPPVQVTGKVTNAEGEPLAGASIAEKGTSNVTVAREDGSFSITVADTRSVLVVSFVGYGTREITVGTQTTVSITLSAATSNLNEVVVVGYGTQRKKDVTGSVVSVDLGDVNERPITNAAQAIQGKAAGVQVVQPSGKPGVGLSIRVRGATSISAGNEPLYVVDGIPTTDIAAVNPNDIESISVLKDASSAAIYGARAANGVVIITTKKGTANKSKVTFNSYYGVSSPTKTIDVLNARQYQEYMNEANDQTIITDEMTRTNVNWPDEVFKTGVEQNYQVAFSGGSDKVQQYISLGYLQQEGMVKPASFDRFSGRFNLTNKLTNWLTVNSNFSFARTNNRDVTDNSSSARGGVVLSALTTPSTVAKYSDTGTIALNPLSGWENPYGTIEGSRTRSISDRLLGNMNAEVRLLRGLTFKSAFGVDYANNNWNTILNPYLTKYGRDEKGQAQQSLTKELVWLTEQTLNYTRSLNGHSFSALAGYSAQKSHWEENYMFAKGFDTTAASKDLEYILKIAKAKSPNFSASEWGLQSYFSRITYDYKNRYLFTGNLRVDGSSKFPEDNRTAVFPSFSAGWRISSEDFFQNVAQVQDLKLRVGWGQNGNQEGIGNYDYLKLYSIDPTNGSQQLSNFANPSLTWEKTTQTNVGVDATILNNRLTVSADWYNKKTEDVLVRMPITPVSGLDQITLNIGSMQNRGFEFNITSRNIVSGDVRWNTDLNLSHNKNKILRLGGGGLQIPFGSIYERGNAVLLKEGYGLGAFYGYVSEGVDPATGDLIYKDLNNNKEVDPGDRTFIGSAQPDFIYGMNNNLTYKNFELTVFLQGSQGNKLFNGARIETEGMFDSRNQSTEVLKRWRKAGDVTAVPRAAIGDRTNNLVSTRFLEDGSYLRLKAATLSYQLNKDLLSRLKISNASVYVTGQNLLTLTKYTGFDPEVSTYSNSSDNNQRNIALGIDYGAYPQARAFIVGLNVSF